MKSTLEIVTLVISISMFVGGLVMWYSGSVRKSYAAQRDFEHLKSSYKQLAENQGNILRELDQRFDASMLEMKELKAMMMALVVKVGAGEHSTGWFRRKDGDEGM